MLSVVSEAFHTHKEFFAFFFFLSELENVCLPALERGTGILEQKGGKMEEREAQLSVIHLEIN
jgi:hypothetical protein